MASKKNISFKVQELPVQKSAKNIKTNPKKISKKILGMTLEDLTNEERNKLNIENNFGVRVKEITGNPAFESGLLKNDIIYQISGKNIKNISQFEKIVKKMKKGDFASLLVRRSQGNSLYLAIKIE